MSYTERLQILVSKQQRDRWVAEARRRGMSVGALVRDQVDAGLGGAPRDAKAQALERILARRADWAPTPEELNRWIDEDRQADWARFPGLGGPRS